MKAINSTKGKEVVRSLTIADTFLSRIRGCIGITSLPAGHGLWMNRCSSIHTIGMRFPIDVVFLDKHQAIVAVKEMVVPNRLTWIYPSATSVLELPAGTIATTTTATGDRITIC